MSRESGGRIEVGGSEPLSVSLDPLPEWLASERTRQRVGFECASGDWIEREYETVPIAALVDAAGFPADTTHLLLESADGYRACVPVGTVSSAVVAVGDGPGKPRFLSPEVIGPRAIKNLETISPRSLAANEDPQEYESLPIDDK